jgi:tRNA threonylcarbamoyladenosine biosynthesis protein TsaB
LAVAHGIPLFPVVSLEAMAEALGAEKVISLLDARMGEVYAASYERSEDGFRLNGQILVASPAEVILPDGAGWQACGNAISAYPILLQRLVDAGIAFDSQVLPNAASLARLAAPRAVRGEGIDAALAAPLYIRDKVAKTVAERLSEGGRA